MFARRYLRCIRLIHFHRYLDVSIPCVIVSLLAVFSLGDSPFQRACLMTETYRSVKRPLKLHCA